MGDRPYDPRQTRERTSMQTGAGYAADLDVGVDVVMVYGVDPSLPERLRSWSDQGYICHCMTGIAWGEYQDYLYGRWDGINHEDEVQMDREGRRISHGGDVYYMCPTESFAEFIAERAQRAIDAGAQAIHLEEPEFWARAGYSEAFKRAWAEYYGESWVPPHESPDARFRASKLMYDLYCRAVARVLSRLRTYADERGVDIRLYIPTHSVLNYARWGIVSPESSLAHLEDCDGYVAQVWTGTARVPNVYRGEIAERTFETAFLEYGALANLTRVSGQRMWLLSDPIEDNPDRSWRDYRENWHSTVIAKLLWPEIWRYETMPWPERILRGAYREDDEPSTGSEPARERMEIPPGYATELLITANALTDMRQERVEWISGLQGCGILISDTMMFQREDPMSSDPAMGFFYGLALPLLEAGIPVQPVQLEFAHLPQYLDQYEVLFLSYEGQKPPSAACHEALRDWVHAGGVLVYLAEDGDPYEGVLEWWHAEGPGYASPREHLFETLGLHPEAHPGSGSGTHRVRAGGLVYQRVSPSSFAHSPDGPERVLRLTRQAYRRRNLRFETSSQIALQRGPYVIAAGVEGVDAGERLEMKGPFIDLFDPELPVIDGVKLLPGERRLLQRIDAVDGPTDRVLCAGSRVYDQRRQGDVFRFTASGPAGTMATTRVRLSDRPRAVEIDQEHHVEARWQSASQTLCLRHPNVPTGTEIVVHLPT
jgi:hypothetical protein